MTRRRRPELERFLEKIAITGGCWGWIGAQATNGYGSFALAYNGAFARSVLAHRWAYERWVGVIPDHLEIDHLCRNRLCVRPDHLETVPRRENVHRSPIAPAAINARKTHCSRGHPFDEANTYVSQPQGYRGCRACARITTNERRRRERAAVPPTP